MNAAAILGEACCMWGVSNHFPPEWSVLPCAESPIEWHSRALHRLLLERGRDGLSMAAAQVAVAREAYHRALWQSARQRDLTRPLVSIVIPAFNEHRELLQTAVASALQQSYPNCEVIVVDDGANPPVAEVLKDFEGRITTLRQENEGVAAARNRGVEASRGEFIHFLDADDLLAPDCVERKMHVFSTVPDVEVCFSLYRCEGDNGVKSAENHDVPPVGDEFCPSRGLLRTMLKRFPFQISTVMMPRWVLLDVGPFEVDLRQSQDNRQWFRLALRGSKVAGINRELSIRRFRPGSLTSRADESAWFSLFSYARNFIDLCRRSDLWTAIPAYFRRLLVPARFELLFYSPEPEVAELRAELLNAVLRLADLQDDCGQSCRPLAETLRSRAVDYRFLWHSTQRSRFQREWLETLDEVEARSRPITERDVAAWLECPTTRLMAQECFSALRTLEREVGSLPNSATRAKLRSRIRERLLSPLVDDLEQDCANHAGGARRAA